MASSGLAAQFSDESALEVCIHVMRYTNRRLYFTLLYHYSVASICVENWGMEEQGPEGRGGGSVLGDHQLGVLGERCKPLGELTALPQCPGRSHGRC